MCSPPRRPKVFISHGQAGIENELETFLHSELSVDPVILRKQPGGGLTIVEKLERYGAKCSAAIIALTADDPGPHGLRRARQNVIHEFGFFQGLLGRNRVHMLLEEGVAKFSNIEGIEYLPLSRIGLSDELKDRLKTELSPLWRIEIESPRHREPVPHRPVVKGHVGDPIAPVWVVIRPVKLHPPRHWVQPVALKSDYHKWSTRVFVGLPEERGAEFEIRAVAAPFDELAEGIELESWPQGQAASAPVMVRRV